MNKERISETDETIPTEVQDHLTGEHAITDIGQLVLFIVFVLIMVLDKFIFHYSLNAIGTLPVIVSMPVFVILFLSGVFLINQSYRVIFGKEKKKSGFVQEGVFRLVRHPMYTGSMLLFLSFVILSYSILALGVWVFICVFYYFVSKHEEKLLYLKLGQTYQNYKNEVPMFIPFWK